MAHKKQGHLTTSGEWKKHLRPYGKRAYWSRERMAAKRREIIGRLERSLVYLRDH